MNTLELKNNLHKLVVETDDPRVLKAIQEVFNSLRAEFLEKNTLSEYEQKTIEKGLEDIKNGNVISNEEVRSKFESSILRIE